jgi:hypothetical protein
MRLRYSNSRRAKVACMIVFFLLALTPLVSQETNTSVAKAPEPGSFRAGGISFSFPPPSDDLIEAGPDYRVLLEPFAPTTNRLVAAFMLQDDLVLLRGGKRAAMTEYALVEVPRRVEFADVTPETFKQIADGTAAQFGANLESKVRESVEDTNRRLKELNSSIASVSVDKPVYLGVLFSKPDAHGFGASMAYSSNGTTTKVVTGVSVIRVKNRVFFAYLYKRYEDESTLLWIRKASEQWADSILSANGH